ncbi:MAG: hypothetical protein AB7K67_00965 [Hyphomicrobiaceae bacterium]
MTPTCRAQAEIIRFLSTEDAETLCFSGQWGVGKTYTWQTILQKATNDKKVGLKRYAYVSLFGINSLEELKLTIFENSDFLLKQDATTTAKAKDLGNRLFAWTRKSTPMAGELPLIGKLIKSGGALFFSAVRDQIVCIDDLERRGSGLAVRDVLGLISFLKEQRRCKVALLLNEDELDEKGRTEFNGNLEKVIDVKLAFSPTAAESVAIALIGPGDVYDQMKTNCTRLGIANIRVIKKIERHARQLMPLLAGLHERAIHQALQSLCLFAWSKYQPEVAPPLDFLKAKRGGDFAGLGNRDEPNAEEASWNALLQLCDFGVIDDFDAAILDGIEIGYFDPDRVKAEAEKVHRERVRQDQDGAFTEAWSSYHDSFANNADEVGQALYDSFKVNYATVTPSNLHATIEVLKGIGQADRARELLALYVAERNEGSDFWDLDQQLHFRNFTDADMIEAFAAKQATFAQGPVNPTDVLVNIRGSNSWTDRDLNLLAALSADDYERIFMESTGERLRAALSSALQFARIGNATPAMQAITNNAREALQRIATTSPLNAMRVRKYGIQVPQEPDRGG